MYIRAPSPYFGTTVFFNQRLSPHFAFSQLSLVTLQTACQFRYPVDHRWTNCEYAL